MQIILANPVVFCVNQPEPKHVTRLCEANSLTTVYYWLKSQIIQPLLGHALVAPAGHLRNKLAKLPRVIAFFDVQDFIIVIIQRF